jgi:hypothetical protein
MMNDRDTDRGNEYFLLVVMAGFVIVAIANEIDELSNLRCLGIMAGMALVFAGLIYGAYLERTGSD